MKLLYLLSLSLTTQMTSKPLEFGKPEIKSTVKYIQNVSGMGRGSKIVKYFQISLDMVRAQL